MKSALSAAWAWTRLSAVLAALLVTQITVVGAQQDVDTSKTPSSATSSPKNIDTDQAPTEGHFEPELWPYYPIVEPGKLMSLVGRPPELPGAPVFSRAYFRVKAGETLKACSYVRNFGVKPTGTFKVRFQINLGWSTAATVTALAGGSEKKVCVELPELAVGWYKLDVTADYLDQVKESSEPKRYDPKTDNTVTRLLHVVE
jgi:hypothetical protein